MTFAMTRILTYATGIVGTALLLPIAVAIKYGESRMAVIFSSTMLAGWIAAAAFWLKTRNHPKTLAVKNAFSVVGGIWIVICLYGAIPLYFSGAFPSFTDAVFESVSGFTTTGASVLSDVESLPRSVNLWRCMSHWLGGMGVITLAVALIPLLGVGGFRLIKAEATGPDKGKFTARIATTAKILWSVYLGMTVIQSAILWYLGMDAVDAVCHAFSTLGTGGFSTRNASVGGFGIPAAEWVCTLFMLLASINFVLYCRLLTGRLSDVFHDSELRAFIVIVLVAVISITGIEFFHGTAGFAKTVRDVCFQVSSIISTTGFMTYDYTQWLPSGQTILLALFCIGGCSGSTAGGIKVIRWTVLAKQCHNEIRRLMHPHAVFSLRVNGIPGREGYVPIIASFMFVYFLLVFATVVAGTLAGLDVFTSVTAALSMVGNIGPAFGTLNPTSNYGFLPPLLKWWYCFAMLAGRLEIYTLLLLATGFRRNTPSRNT
ncbi:MAG: TrkH family potassium uptake protein [Kiritimatiellae bacterium]|nr:TrkH family potassium uptake protein [Kiritimatiellia bacterium]